MTVLETKPPPGNQGGPPQAGSVAPRRWKWTGDDLIRMGEAGLLPPEGRFELLDGEIYELLPPGPLHACIVELIHRVLERVARVHGSHARSQNPIRLSPRYDPQPDIAVVRGRERDYRERFPGPEDVLLVVEVCDSSVEHDRKLKLPAYAAADIPECWLVNLPEQQVEVYVEPTAAGYRTRRICLSGEVLDPLAAPGAAIPVTDLLGEGETEAA